MRNLATMAQGGHIYLAGFAWKGIHWLGRKRMASLDASGHNPFPYACQLLFWMLLRHSLLFQEIKNSPQTADWLGERVMMSGGEGRGLFRCQLLVALLLNRKVRRAEPPKHGSSALLGGG